MTRFTATVESAADISADREAVWKALTDPDLLARMTPLLADIRADGDVWTWTMIRFSALGVTICPSFTEKMTFDDGRRIDYTHAPPNGTSERAGAEGSYVLGDVAGGTRLAMQMTLSVELPLPLRGRQPRRSNASCARPSTAPANGSGATCWPTSAPPNSDPVSGDELGAGHVTSRAGRVDSPAGAHRGRHRGVTAYPIVTAREGAKQQPQSRGGRPSAVGWARTPPTPVP